MTLVASATSQRGLRLREGTQAHIANSIIVAAPNGAASGLIDIGDVQTADSLASKELVVEDSIFFGPWPATGQKDSAGTLYVEADYFMWDRGEQSNRESPSLAVLLPGALDEASPGWVPRTDDGGQRSGVVRLLRRRERYLPADRKQHRRQQRLLRHDATEYARNYKATPCGFRCCSE